MRRILRLAAVLLPVASSAHANIFPDWFWQILPPPQATIPQIYTVFGYFPPSVFGQKCEQLLGGCVNDCNGPVHFYYTVPPGATAPLTEIQARYWWRVGVTQTCHIPVVSPPIPDLK
jgi:hypothetical protein